MFPSTKVKLLPDGIFITVALDDPLLELLEAEPLVVVVVGTVTGLIAIGSMKSTFDDDDELLVVVTVVVPVTFVVPVVVPVVDPVVVVPVDPVVPVVPVIPFTAPAVDPPVVVVPVVPPVVNDGPEALALPPNTPKPQRSPKMSARRARSPSNGHSQAGHPPLAATLALG